MTETALAITEDARIEGAVDVINNIVASKVYDGAIQVGNYILEAFFDNDPAEAASRQHDKSVTYRKLSTRTPAFRFHARG